MREPRNVRNASEGINLSLDNKQVVSFVIGSLVVLGMVFTLGVLVGKQLAAGAAAAVTKPAGDPLATIDAKEKVRTGIEPATSNAVADAQPPKQDSFTFEHELTKPKASEPYAEAAKSSKEGKDDKKPKSEKSDKPEKADKSEKQEKLAANEAKAEKADKVEKKEKIEKLDKEKTDKLAAEKLEKEKLEKARAEKEKAEKDRSDKAEKERSEKLAAAFDKANGAKAPGQEFYTLQVASYPSRAEAEKAVSKLASGKLSPSIVEADVPGKGHVFRVRVGAFSSRSDAEVALEDLKKRSSVSAIIISAK